MKVAVCFWGIARSLNHTLASIQECIFKPLQESGISFDILLHTYIVNNIYENKRAKETCIQLDNDSWKQLNPHKYIIENQEEIYEQLNVLKYRNKGDPWYSNFQTFDNHILALWSLKQVTSLYDVDQYDYIIYVRPDVKYFKKITEIDFMNLEENVALLPNFHTYPINDRFCIAKPAAAKKYGNRFDFAYEFSLQNQLHSERFLNWTLEKHSIKYINVHFPFHRVRANGVEIDFDVK